MSSRLFRASPFARKERGREPFGGKSPMRQSFAHQFPLSAPVLKLRPSSVCSPEGRCRDGLPILEAGGEFCKPRACILLAADHELTDSSHPCGTTPGGFTLPGPVAFRTGRGSSSRHHGDAPRPFYTDARGRQAPHYPQSSPNSSKLMAEIRTRLRLRGTRTSCLAVPGWDA